MCVWREGGWHCLGVNVRGSLGWAYLGTFPGLLHSFFKKEASGNLKCMLLSKRNQFEKASYCIIPIIWQPGKGKTLEIIKRSVVGYQKWGCWERWAGRA